MRGATEDEQPVHFLQAAQLDLAQRPGLLQPAEALLDQPSATQADGISRMPSGPAIQVAAPFLVVLRNIRSDVQLAAGGNKILRVVGLVNAHRKPRRIYCLASPQKWRCRRDLACQAKTLTPWRAAALQPVAVHRGAR